ncbi:MAG: alpha/beta hydrolase [Candidatus Omnitrophica bacterium]|nr:alpha/beta hydrolase [Candidatus Omnitrophota bacterium]
MGITEFKFIDRGMSTLAVLIPGWGTDSRIFERVDIGYNYLVPLTMSLDDVFVKLEKILEGEPAVIFGWSLGAFIGANFMALHPHLVKKLVMVGVMPVYPEESIEKMKKYLSRNKRAYMCEFFKKCANEMPVGFVIEHEKQLFSEYAAYGDKDELVSQLDYLKNGSFPEAKLRKYQDKLVFIFGERDGIVPSVMSERAREMFPNSLVLVSKGFGHMCFLDPGIKQVI